MESNKFDALARRAVGEDSSRRGVLRAGISALGGTALAVVGLRTADDAAADNKKNNKKNHRKDSQFRRQHRRISICYNGETLEVKKAGAFERFPGAQQGPCACQGNTPLQCGIGCCPPEFGVCCSNPVRRDERTARPGEAGGSICAPATSACCPTSIGGGACDQPNNTCCPPTSDAPRGGCAPAGATCCTNRQAGGFCAPPFTQCCQPTAARPQGACCLPGQVCATGPAGTTGAASGCPAGQVVSAAGCCVTPGQDPAVVGGNAGGGVTPRFQSADGGGARQPVVAKVGGVRPV